MYTLFSCPLIHSIVSIRCCFCTVTLYVLFMNVYITFNGLFMYVIFFILTDSLHMFIWKLRNMTFIKASTPVLNI